MNLEKLEVGMTVKNYKEMCKLVGEDVKSGNSKIYQLKEWECHFSFSKEGNKFIINELYNNPLQRESRGGARNSKYADLIDLLVLDLLAQSDGVLTIGKNKLMELIGMVNFNYSIGKNYINFISNKLDANVRTVRDFYNSNDSNLGSAVESSLNRLSNKALLMYDYTYMIKSSDNGKFRIASDEDLSIIGLVENRLLKKYKADNKNEVRINGEWTEFKKDMSEMLKVVSDIQYYFRAYKIISNKDNVTNAKSTLMENLLKNEDKVMLIDKLNRLVIKSNEDNAKNRMTKFNSNKSHRNTDKYFKDINKLSHLLISNDNNIRINDLKNESDVVTNKALSQEKLDEIKDAIEGLF